ncbi:MAG: tetratricopeptide repeat protein [Bacteroidota bacterium]
MKIYFYLLLLPLGLKAQVNQHQLIDSLTNRLAGSAEDTVKVRLLDLLSYTYSTIDPDKGIAYGIQTQELSERLGWNHGLASAYADLGINYAAKSDHSKAIYYDLKALALFKSLNSKNSMAGTMANLSMVYLAKSDYPKAFDYAFKALKIKDELGDDNTVAIIQENIGNIYLEQKNYAKTLEYYAKAQKTHEKLGNKNAIARVLGNQGIVADAKGNHEQALIYHLQALETNKKYGNKHSIQINLENIGIVYSHLYNYARALEYQLSALKISEEEGNKSSIAINIGNIGETYLFSVKDSRQDQSTIPGGRTANLNHAIQYLAKAVRLCEEIHYIAPMIEFEAFLSEAYQLSGNYQKSLEAFKHFTAHKDTVFSEQTQIKLSDIETQRELDVRDKDIIIKNKQIEIAQLEAANKRIERTAFIIIFILLIIIIGIAIRKLLKRIKTQRSALEDIAGMHAHEIRGPVARITGLTQLFNHDNLNDPVNKELINAIHMVSLQLDEIVKKIIRKTET